MVFRERSEEDDQMNTIRKPVMVILERARRILGMTTRQIFTEDTVLIACPDSCKWGLVVLRSSQRRPPKEE